MAKKQELMIIKQLFVGTVGDYYNCFVKMNSTSYILNKYTLNNIYLILQHSQNGK